MPSFQSDVHMFWSNLKCICEYSWASYKVTTVPWCTCLLDDYVQHKKGKEAVIVGSLTKRKMSTIRQVLVPNQCAYRSRNHPVV